MINRTFRQLAVLITVMTALCLLATVARGDVARDPEPGRPLIYLAGPLGFSLPGREYQEKTLIPALEHLGYRVFDPWQSADSAELKRLISTPPGPNRPAAWRALDQKIGVKNAKGIEECDVVLAVLDGSDVDSGTAAEVGFAAAKNKPIVGYRSDFRLASDNEGSTVNLQVEHFIVASGGTITHTLEDASRELSRLVSNESRHKDPVPGGLSGDFSRPMAKSNDDGGANADALEVVRFFSAMFTIVLALALGEAFKQFVSDKAERPQDRTMHWDRLPALIIFLVTIIPFFEGMNRLFQVKYIHATTLRAVYPASLIVDTAAFMIESILFFVMSRALSPAQIVRLVVTLFFLFATDLARDLVETIHAPHVFGPWVWQNLVAVTVLAVALWLCRMHKERIHRPGPSGGFDDSLAAKLLYALAVLATIRTVVDYYYMWNFYFPAALE